MGEGRLTAARGMRDRPSTSGRSGSVARHSAQSFPHPCSPDQVRGRLSPVRERRMRAPERVDRSRRCLGG
jgi:hypothetical protein